MLSSLKIWFSDEELEQLEQLRQQLGLMSIEAVVNNLLKQAILKSDEDGLNERNI